MEKTMETTKDKIMSENKVINKPIVPAGRKPLSAKPKPSVLQHDDLFGNACSIPQELRDELDAQGLECRFIDAKRLYEMNGYHDKGWIPYKREAKASDKVNASDWKFGNDPGGVVRRGSLILAVKTKEQVQKHKLYLKQKADRQKGFNAEKAAEMRKFAKDNNLPAEIHEGFEENDDGE